MVHNTWNACESPYGLHTFCKQSKHSASSWFLKYFKKWKISVAYHAVAMELIDAEMSQANFYVQLNSMCATATHTALGVCAICSYYIDSCLLDMKTVIKKLGI